MVDTVLLFGSGHLRGTHAFRSHHQRIKNTPPVAIMNANENNYFIETATYRRIKSISGTFNQTRTPQISTITHLTTRLHTEVQLSVLMIAITRLGTSEPHVFAMHSSELSLLSPEEQAKALAMTTIQAIYEVDIPKPTILLAGTAEMAKMLGEAFFAIGSECSSKVASEEENELVNGKWEQLMELEKGSLGRRALGICCWIWNQRD